MNAALIRQQVEATLAHRIPSALTPRPQHAQPTIPTGIPAVDALTGGFPRGGLTEICGVTSSGRTSLLISFIAQLTQAGEVCTLVDASDTFDPRSAAHAGIVLSRLLWVRCGYPFVREEINKYDHLISVAVSKLSPHLRSRSTHPPAHDYGINNREGNISRELEKATSIGGLRNASAASPSHPDRARQLSPSAHPFIGGLRNASAASPSHPDRARQLSPSAHPSYTRNTNNSRQSAHNSALEQALKAADLLLESGGFGAVILDLGDIPAKLARRVPLTSWFRFRRTVENTDTALVVLEQKSNAKTCASLVLELSQTEVAWTKTQTASALPAHPSLLNSFSTRVEIIRSRLQPPDRPPVSPLRKPPLSSSTASASSTNFSTRMLSYG